MKFIHIADIHMGMGFSTASFGSRKGQERRKEIKETMLRIIGRCQEEQTDLLLVAGDVFEEAYVTLSELKDINRSFSKLSHTKVLMSAGNHDPILDLNSPYRLIDWCEQVYLFGTSMESVYLEALNTEIWSFSWDKKHLPPLIMSGDLVMDRKRNNVLMLHGDVYQENDYLYINKKLLEPLGFDYVALGHIHKPAFIEPWLAYPGSLEPLDFSETGDHGFIEGVIDNHLLKADFVAFAKRSFHRVDVLVEGTMPFEAIYDHILGTLQALPKDDFYRITLKGDIDPEVDLDLSALRERLETTYYYIELKDATQLDLNIDQLEQDYEGTLIGSYIQAMKQKGLDDPVVADALKKGLRILMEEQVRQ